MAILLRGSRTVRIHLGWFLPLMIAISLFAGCGGGNSSTSTSTPPAPVPTSITLTPASATIATGAMRQLTATANLSDGSAEDVTSQATWSSSVPSIVSVQTGATNAGLVTGLASGKATISAAFQGINGSSAITVAATMATDTNRWCPHGTSPNLTDGTPIWGAADSVAALPQTCLNTLMASTPSPGSVINVNPNDSTDLQNKINAAASVCGETLVLPAGSVYASVITLPATNCDGLHWITIETSDLSSLPNEQTRITPCYAGVASLPGRPSYPCSSPVNHMAQISIQTSGNYPDIAVSNGASHFRLIGLELTKAPGLLGANPTLVGMTATTNTADHIIIDRCWIHGTALDETQVGVTFNGGWSNSAVINSYLNDMHCTAVTGTCVDSQAVSGGVGQNATAASTLKVANNFLEAAAEGTIFGGGGSTTVPNDLEFRRNHYFKPTTWNPADPNYIGTKFIVKNHFEMKNGNRVLFEDNVMENTWVGADQGAALVLVTPKNQNGHCTVCATTNIVIRWNYGHTAYMGFQIAMSRDDTTHLDPSAGNSYSVHDNLMDNIGNYTTPDACYNCTSNTQITLGIGMDPAGGSSQDLHDLDFSHNTLITVTQPVAMVGTRGPGPPAAMSNLRIENNVQDGGHLYGVQGDDSCGPSGNNPTTVLNGCFNPWTFAGNVLPFGTQSIPIANWPSSNNFPADWMGVGFANFNNGYQGDYRLCHGAGQPAPCSGASSYTHSATDATARIAAGLSDDPGVDISTLNLEIADVD